MKRKICFGLAALICVASMLGSCTGTGTETTDETTEETIAETEEETQRDSIGEILSVTNRQELADMLNCSIDELDDYVTYVDHLNNILPESGETTTEFARGTSSEGLDWVTKEEAKTFADAILITKDNWYDFFVAEMITETIYCTDMDGNETIETETEPEIHIKDGYSYDWQNFSIILKENTTGQTIEFNHYWPCSVIQKDGKFYTQLDNMDEPVEFTPENFTCVKADGVVYSNNVPEELLFVMDDDWNYLKYSEHKDEYDLSDTMLPVVEDAENPEYTLCLVGYESIGEYAYEN